MRKNTASKTAELGSMIRAIATQNKYGKEVFNDPFSILFIGHRIILPFLFNSLISKVKPNFFSKGMNSVGFLLSLCRHRFMYNEIEKCSENKYKQIVIVGAGYDTSSLLLKENSNNLTFFEVDHPATQKRKIKILQKHFGKETATMIPMDLNKESISKRLKHHVNKDTPTLIIIEGLLSYIDKENLLDLLKDLKELSKEIKVVADYRKPNLNLTSNPLGKKWLRNFKRMDEKYVSFFSEHEINMFLENTGYTICQHIDLLDLWKEQSSLKVNSNLKEFGGLIVLSYEQH